MNKGKHYMKRLKKPKNLNPNNKLNTRNIFMRLNNMSFGDVHGTNLLPIDKSPPIKYVPRPPSIVNIPKTPLSKTINNMLDEFSNIKTKGDD